ncbi:MAG: hypothetical protein LBJ00_02105 [Planctomycetaceae bacterium]|nr:hypothetical protein [Planctomycetaceae bacterium]
MKTANATTQSSCSMTKLTVRTSRGITVTKYTEVSRQLGFGKNYIKAGMNSRLCHQTTASRCCKGVVNLGNFFAVCNCCRKFTKLYLFKYIFTSKEFKCP